MHDVSAEDRTWGMLCHLAAFSGIVIPILGSIVGPLVIWLLKKDQSRFVNDQGKESLNFQISILIYELVAGVLVLLLIGLALLPLVFLAWVILTIIAAIKANDGVAYRYPLTIRFLH